ncbi:MAG: hypothetical protein ACYC3P_05325 [Bellilinea sp.]
MTADPHVIASERSERGDLRSSSNLLRFGPAACRTSADCFDLTEVSQ